MTTPVLVCAFTLRRDGTGAPYQFPRKGSAQAIQMLGGAPIAETVEVVPAHRVDFNGFLLDESECAPPQAPAPAP